MELLVITLIAAFACGLAAHLLRLPPLIGFIAAGFLLSALGVEPLPGLADMGRIGVALMLFTIGLHLDPRVLLRPQVWATAGAHMLAVSLLSAVLLAGLAVLGVVIPTAAGTLVLIGLLLSFSSTILVLKILQDRDDERSLYGRLAIGVLLMQDAAAVAVISFSTGEAPSPWALTLLVLIPLLVLATRRWQALGDGDLGVLFGLTIALVPGYALFEALGLSGELGALAMGLVVARTPGADQLARTLFSLRELMLIGFFLNIGFLGVPSVPHVVQGLALLLLLPLQGIGYWLLLVLLGMRHRTAVLSSLALTNFSEFALIVAALGVEAGWLASDWMHALVVAVAASFVVAAVLNPLSVSLATRISARLGPRPLAHLHPDERPIDLGDARAIVLGMGRVNRRAYDRLSDDYGLRALGVEHDATLVAQLRASGRWVVEGDATDAEFWARVREDDDIELIALAMPTQHANVEALAQLRASGSDRVDRTIAAIARYREDVEEFEHLGLETVVHLYAGAGETLADLAAETIGLPYQRAEGTVA